MGDMMKREHCFTCEFIKRYHDFEYSDFIDICLAEQPEDEDGFLIYRDVGHGDHVDCKLYKKKKGD